MMELYRPTSNSSYWRIRHFGDRNHKYNTYVNRRTPRSEFTLSSFQRQVPAGRGRQITGGGDERLAAMALYVNCAEVSIQANDGCRTDVWWLGGDGKIITVSQH